jgi:ABC-type glutathione transport system ATPase component
VAQDSAILSNAHRTKYFVGTWLELVDLLAAHRDDGGAICAVTHDEAVVASLADRVLALDGGVHR